MTALSADDVVDERVGGTERPDDAAILARARLDPRAFEPLYRRYYRPIFGYCLRRLRDREEAADATSQTFAKALAGIQGFRQGSVAAWLFTIARHVVIDTARRRRPHTGLEAAGAIATGEPEPHEAAIANDQQRALLRAMERLTEDQRQVVELRLAGLSGQEVADVLGLGLGAVKSSQFRAYSRLRRLLLDEEIFGGPA